MLRRDDGLIERYRERLPFATGDPVVSLGEGITPLVLAPTLSERVGVEVWCKLEGLNPTGSFKDRGMTCAVSAAVREGAQAIVCASTGNTAASAAAYAARAGLRCAVIVPEGKIATGKLAQALMHGARVIALRGQLRRRPQAGPRARGHPPDRPGQLGQRVPDRGPEDGRVRDQRGARGRARRPLHPRRQRRQHHRLLARLLETPPAARGCSGSRPPAPRRWSTARRSSSPRRWPARSGSATRPAGRTR